MNKKRLDKSNIQDILGLTPMQEGMLFHYQSNSESKQYLEQLCLTLYGEIDENLIKIAWNHVTQNNEMLRTIFKWDKLDKPLQIILKQNEIPYNKYDLSNINSVDKTMQIMDIRDNELNKKIDISENPIRMTIIKLNNSKFELIITYHHILYDGWSNGILIKEFVQACNCLCADKPLSKISKNKFKEFIKYYQKQDKAKQEDFWHKQLSNYEIKSTIKTNVSDIEDCVVNKKVNYKLNNKISEGIYEFCKKEKTTVAALLYTAWGILLQKYNNINDIVFGTTVSGRNVDITGIEYMVGLFINTLPLRVNSTKNENIQSLLKKVNCILKERDEYQSTPLVDIKSYSGLYSKEELFDTLVVIENYPLDQVLLNGDNHIRIEEYSMTEMTNYKLTLAITDFEGLEFQLSYDTSIFNGEEINRMARHFENIIINIIENTVYSISQIDMLTEEERQQILIDFNNTKTDYPKDKTIYQLFEEQVERTPDNIAVVYEDKRLTYRELNQRANQLARSLRNKGVGPDTIVGIMVERSLEMIIGIMGVLKSGGAYIPIDPEYPKDRIEYMLQDSGTKLILIQKCLEGYVLYNKDFINIDEASIYEGDNSNLELINRINNLAYIIYTSGSTGKPKGVMIEHKNVYNSICSRINEYVFKSEDNVLQLFSFAFDGFVTSFFTPILSGSKVILMKDEDSKNPISIKEHIKRYGISHFISVPSLYSAILECSDKKDLETLKIVTLAGENISESLIKQSKDIKPNLELVNEYGPTENSVVTTISRDIQAGEKVTIGKPIANTKVYIIDTNNNPQPIGVAGELCISGEGLARGYLNRSELTSEKFVDNPFESEMRMYRTGDLAKWLPDGNIEFLGRIDYQVKIRGYRIEIGEIEYKLLSHEEVKETVVIARDDNGGNKYLCAYIVGAKDLTVSELRAYLSKVLPEYMIPSYFMQMEKIPLTPNGKVDRKALPEPNGSISTVAEYEAPRSNTEEKLVEIWRDVLGLDQLGINDNFFELGGHSLKATSLVAKIHKVLNAEIPIREIFRTPTIKGISEYIKGSKESIYSSIEPVEEKEYYEMSSAQKRMYTLQQLEINSTSYNMPGVLELEGALDVARLKEVFNNIIQRHEALRTSFEVVEEGLIQKVHKEIEFDIEQYRVESEEEIKDIVKNFIRAFDLSKTPLLRVGLVKVNLNKHMLMFDMHHIISDGVSMGIMVEEFSKAYSGEELKPLRVQYKDFSEWQNKLFKSEEIKAQEEYWLKQFEVEIPVLNFPTDYQRPVLQSFEGASIQFEIDKALTKKLRQIVKDTESTMYMVLLGTFNILLSKYSGQEDIIVGSPIAGRPHADLDNIIGMFVNTLAMRNYPSGEKTFIEFLREVKENALGAYENQDYQFEELVEKLNIPRNFSRNPVFDVMFVLQNIDMGELTAKGLKINPYKLDNMISKFDITMNAVELENSISIDIQYCTKLFNMAKIERMYKHLGTIIQVVTENINIKLSDVDILTEEERQQILINFNSTKADYSKDKTIHQIFEEQAEHTPNNIAVVFEDKRLTYRELNERSNQLARKLRSRGIASDSIVAIMIERSLEMIIGIMGILKAGGAYLPIDPKYSKDRIEYMLQDSETRILLQKGKVNNYDIEALALDEDFTNYPTENLETISDYSNLAYIIYTSGSTGKPKGTMIKQRGLVNYITWANKVYVKNESLDFPLYSSFSFDLTVTSIFTPLISGNKIVIYKYQEDEPIIRQIFKENKVGIVKLTPAHLSMIKDMDNSQSSIKRLIVGGEDLKTELAKEVYESFNKNVEIYNEYGPTETVVGCMLYRYDYYMDKNISVSIGKPADNVQIYILNKEKQVLPIGIVGEIYIGGDGVSKGYINRAELTAESFIANPFVSGEQMYRTGDLARWLIDGNIEFLGRIDHQVKIRGYRIELGEIENKLLSHEAVKETVVIARDDNSGNKYLCAYIVMDYKLTIAELRDHILKDLPDYMIPSYFIQLEKLPLTSNGKVDRKALPEPDYNISTGAEYEAPRNSIEEKLVAIWREALGVEKIGINDNFFELGGHSLKAVNLAAKIQKALEVEISIGEIFKNTTIKEISNVILERKNIKFKVITPAEERDYYPVSSSQKRLYIQNQIDENNTSYNISSLMSIEGSVDIQKFEQTFNFLIRRHESLRTSFEFIDGGIVQKIQSVQDMSYFKIAYDETLIDIEKLTNELVRPFNLSKAPLLRVALIKRDSNKYIFILDMHHIISDGISINIMVNEFMKLYAGEELPKLQIQYKDYAVWEKELYQNHHKNLQEKYWLNKLEGLSNCELPITKLSKEINNRGSIVNLILDEQTVNKIDKYCKKNRVTKFTFILTVFKILLFGEINQTDICIGTPIAGRKYSGLEHIIGVFLNVQMLRTKVQNQLTFAEYMKIVDETVLEAQDNQDYPYEELYAKFKDMFNYEGDSLFNIMLNYMPYQESRDISIEGLSIKPIKRDKHSVKYSTTLYVNELVDKLVLSLDYNNSLYSDESMGKILNNMKNIINMVLENENILIENIGTVIYGDLDYVAITLENEIDGSLQGNINKIVKEYPNKIAIECGSKKISYLELENASNLVAEFLYNIKSGNKNILMLMEKGEYIVESILATIKSGYVFVPLDPKFPVSRLSTMADISDSEWIVTQSKWLRKANELAKTLNRKLNVILIDKNIEEYEEYENLSINVIDNYNYDSIEGSDQIINENCYIYFTSGSTGKPKGVLGRHRSLKHFMEWEIGEFNIDSSFKISQLTSPSFDPFLRDIFVPLCAGGTLCIPENDEIILNPRRLVKWIDENQINLIHMVPSLLKQLIEVIEDSNCLNSLKYILLAGELLRGNDIKKFTQMFGSRIQLVNLYGPTETTLAKFFYRVNEEDIDRSIIPVGKPVNSTNALILNNEMLKCRTGSIGEIYIRTPNISSGYYKEPSMTKEVFLVNPFSDNSQDIIYKTGDLGRILPDGNMEVVGRKDNQVKIRGFRIEIGEIENRLLNHKEIKEAAIIAKEDNTGNKYLCAYIQSDKKLTVTELREYLSKDLPEYMLPSYFIQMDKLPMTLNGKVDRKALPEPDGNISTRAEYEAPRDEIEEKLVRIWREVLGIEKVGINDNFFDLGGHSLKAISVGAKIHKELNIEISLKKMFEAPTIKGISEYIKNSKESIYSSIEPIEEKEYYEMSSAQKRVYTLQQLELNSTSYNIPRILELDGYLDIDKLKEVFNKLIQRHEALRTSFEVLEEGLIQKVHSQVEFNIEEYESEEEKEIEEIVKDFIRAFDLSKAPLLRVGLVKVQSNKHILMYDMHHIISDGTSMGILVNEFSKVYDGKQLIPLKIQYKDFSEWQNNMYRTYKIEEQEKYWLKQFEGEIPVLNLPTDYPRPAIQSFEGDSLQFEIDNELTNKLRQIAKATGSTMYMVLLSAFNILLSKYSGQEDIIVGSPIAGRPHADLENIIGMFINTLAMRNFPSGEKTFKDFLREVKDNALGAYENQDYQFEELVEKLNVARDFSRNPVFDVMFVLQNMDMEEVIVKDINIKPYISENKVSKLDMTISAVELENRISISIQYCTKIFNKSTIEKMYKHLEKIIQEVSENIDTKLSEIEILTKEERQQILIDFNNTNADYPNDKTIHQLFEEQVERTPDNIAVVYEDENLTYRELNNRANQLARVLRDKGIESNNIVGIMVGRSLEMIIGIIGILKAGGAYLPIDPEYPQDRIEYMLQDSRASILLTQNSIKDKVEFKGQIIELEDEKLYQRNTINIDINRKPQDIAYVIYTSASTGKPKGVMIEDSSVVNFITGMINKIEFTPDKTILAVTTISFDIFGLEILLPLTIGLKIIIADESSQKDVNKLSEIIYKHKVDIIQTTPSRMKLLTENNDIKAFESLKEILIGGEALPQSLLQKLRSKTKANIYNLYGPTETTIWSTVRKLSEGQINIGKQIANTKVYIVDKHCKIVPVGVAGELCIAGAGLARGYINRSELTAEKFPDNPFEPRTKMYRTGDLARWLPDGNIDFLGRIDHQVKIRGYRIELGEIENKLLSYDAVKETVVTAKDDNDGNNYLCAYLTGDKDIKVSELREYLLKDLPDYMIPSYFIHLEKLPLTPNGKVDRKALPKPDGNISTGAEYELPRNSTEEKLVKIWREVLGIEKIGINDNFFELGGHSLKATSLCAKIHKKLNVEISLKEIFNTPTIKGISEYIKGSKESIYSSIESVEEKEYYEMSSAQKRMYTLQQFDSYNISYNIYGVLELEGSLDTERLKEAFNKMIQRHETLRTSFEVLEEGLMQKVHGEVELEIEQYKVKSKDEIKDIVRSFIRAFDLSKAPLLRVGLVKVKSNKHILMYDMHHIISDGKSMGILVDEFSKVYDGKELIPLRIQYKDFSEWQNNMYKTYKIEEQEKYWLKQFEGEIPVLNLPIDYQRSAAQSFEGASIQFEIGKELTNKLRQIAKATGSTMYMVLLSAFNILLSKYSGQEDIIVGSPIEGRPHADLENIIGVFVNTLAMRNYPSGEKTFTEFLSEVKENALGAYENQDYQFEELVEKLNVARDFSRNPIFDVMFVLQNMDIGEVEIDSIKIKSYKSENKISKFDMTMTAVEVGDSISIDIQYCTKLFNKITIEKMCNHLEKIIQAVTENIDIKLSEVKMLTEEESHQILIDFNNTKADYPKDKTIHQLFEEQVERTPDSIAVICENKSLTYRNLNKKANQLARVLREKGVVSDSIVGIMVERSLEMIVGIMAILKSGGAYLPIDTEYPKDRIAYIVKDSKCSLLLTQEKLTVKVPSYIQALILEDENLYKGDCSCLDTVAEPNNLAYIIYTSGSTGTPKGVMLEHSGVVNTLYALKDKYPIKENDAYLLKTAYTFDVSVSELFEWFMGAGRLVILKHGAEKEPMEILRAVRQYQVTHLNFVPSMLRIFIQVLEGTTEKPDTLKYIFSAGEALSLELVKSFKHILSNVSLENLYGPTEATIYATKYSLAELKDGMRISIGKPIENTKAYIVDIKGRLQPIGVVGELCLGGAGLARGYLNRPELTAEKFVDNPFESVKRMYRTGDFARWLPDGNIEYLGRIDHQVKIRGYRIELGEIESKLLTHEALKEAVVIARDEDSGSMYLCAYIVGDKEFTVLELREHLFKYLPDYMIPSYFIQLKNLPLTPNGKVDRKALPEPDGNISTGAEYEASRNKTEEKLVKIWREVLGIEKIGINDSFFNLGGHSLKATSLAAKIHKELSVEIPLREIFNAPTIKEMSKYIMNSTESTYSPIQPLDKSEYYEISYSQKRLWILNQLEPNSIAYNITSNFTIYEELDEQVFNKAFIKLIERHESLRTSFDIIEGEPVQLIKDNLNFNLIKFDISSMEDEKRLQKRQQIISMELDKSFDLKTAPLYRVLLVKYKNKEYEIMISIHHIISDGWSMDVLKREFLQLYNSYKSDLAVELKPLTVQYKDFASWQNNLIKDKIKTQKAKEFWIMNMGGDNPILNLPISDNAGLNINGSSGYRCIISGVNRDKLKQLAQEKNASLYSILLGILNIYLSVLTKQDDIIIGSAGSGRQHDDVNGVMGFFVNTIFIRNKIDMNDTFENILKNINENIINVLEYQSYPLELLLDELKISYPKISVFFNMLNIGERESVLIEDLESYHLEQVKEVKFDLVFYVKEYANAIEILVNYKSNLFEPDIIENMVNQYIKIMEHIADNHSGTIKAYKKSKAKRKFTLI